MLTLICDHKRLSKRNEDASKTSLLFKLLTVNIRLAQPMSPITNVEHTNANKICHVCFGFSDLKVRTSYFKSSSPIVVC